MAVLLSLLLTLLLTAQLSHCSQHRKAAHSGALPFIRCERPSRLGPGACGRGRSFRCHLVAMKSGPRQPNRRAGGSDHARLGRRRGHGVHQDVSPLSISRPRSKATFFWISITASARRSCTVRRLLSRSSWACSASRGLAGASRSELMNKAPRVEGWRRRRQALRGRFRPESEPCRPP
jgi:hypothetical protein